MIIAYQALFKLLYTYFLFNLPQIFDIEIFVLHKGVTQEAHAMESNMIYWLGALALKCKHLHLNSVFTTY